MVNKVIAVILSPTFNSNSLQNKPLFIWRPFSTVLSHLSGKKFVPFFESSNGNF